MGQRVNVPGVGKSSRNGWISVHTVDGRLAQSKQHSARQADRRRQGRSIFNRPRISGYICVIFMRVGNWLVLDC